jgi:hypothetical protein
MDAATATVYVSIATSIAMVASTVGVAYLQTRTRKAVEDSSAAAKLSAGEAAVQVKEVKSTLETSTSEAMGRIADLQKVTNDTHTLVNSNMGVQLKLNASVTRRLAVMTGNADDIAVADLAQSMYDEHVKKQAVVDAGKQ